MQRCTPLLLHPAGMIRTIACGIVTSKKAWLRGRYLPWLLSCPGRQVPLVAVPSTRQQ